MTNRSVLHIDMNAFYASCHAASDPKRYARRPTAVAGAPETRHGVIVTASYEARARGVRTTMTVQQALRICPNLTLIQPDFALYRSFARNVFDIVRRFTPQVEIVSIDECYADVTGSSQFGDGLTIAKRIQQSILHELKLPCSIGIADCKFFAKMASDMKKPMGLTVLDRSNFQQLLWPLPVGEMHGVGAKTRDKLHRLKIRTIEQLAMANQTLLQKHFGVRGLELQEFARGNDNRPVVSERAPAKSVGHSITLPQDATTKEAIHRVLLNLSDQVGRRLRQKKAIGRSVILTLRFNNMETITRRKVLPYPTDLTEHIYKYVQEALDEAWNGKRPIRLVGVTIGDLQQKEGTLTTGIQTTLFDAEKTTHEFFMNERLERLTQVTDDLRNRFGEDIVVRGRMLQPDDSNALRDHKTRGTSLQKDQLYKEE